MQVRTVGRKPPSWLWGVTEERRNQLLSKRDPKGHPVWKLDQIPEDQIFKAPAASSVDLALAKLGLLAELNQERVTYACNVCGASMGAERGEQVCEGCNKKERE